MDWTGTFIIFLFTRIGLVVNRIIVKFEFIRCEVTFSKKQHGFLFKKYAILHKIVYILCNIFFHLKKKQ